MSLGWWWSYLEVEIDIRYKDWFDKFKKFGFVLDFSIVWVFEGSIFFLVDFMNKLLVIFLNFVFYFYSDWFD